MKNKRFVSLFTGMIFLVGIPCAMAVDWQTFTSQAGGFSILMPGTPTLHQSAEKSFVGTIGVNLFELTSSKGQYSVEYSDLPGIAVDLGGHKTILDKAKEAFIKDNGVMEMSFTDIAFHGHPGKALNFQVKDSGAIGKAYFYLIKKRLYVLAASHAPTAGKPQNIQQFLNSFQLLAP
jgi:hypothetical protein